MELRKLEKLGLNTSEAKIYLALIDLGKAQAGEISKKTQINRTTVYDSLERLIEKGLVTYVIQANKKLFQPVSPDKMLEIIKEQEVTLKEILPELHSRFKTSKEKEESNIYKGRKGIRSILNDILNYKEYISYGSSGEFLEIMKHDFYQFQKSKKELKIKSRVILSEKLRNKEIVRASYAKYRFISHKYSSPTTIWVYGDNTAIVIWSEIPVATLITSKQVAKSYKNYFELLWRTAKK